MQYFKRQSHLREIILIAMFIALTLIISSVQGTFGPLFVTTLSFIYFTANVTIDVIKKRFGLLRAIEYGFIALITAYLGFSL